LLVVCNAGIAGGKDRRIRRPLCVLGEGDLTWCKVGIRNEKVNGMLSAKSAVLGLVVKPSFFLLFCVHTSTFSLRLESLLIKEKGLPLEFGILARYDSCSC
jgi:hypothetical protein